MRWRFITYRAAWVAASTVGCLLLARPASAGTLTLTFDISQSVISATLVGVASTVGSTWTSGTVRISLSGVDSRGRVTGAGVGRLQDLSLTQANMGFGSARVLQIDPASGSFDGTRLVVQPGRLSLELTQMFPFGVLGRGTGSAFRANPRNATPATFRFTGLGAMGALSARVVGPFSNNLRTDSSLTLVSIALTGREVARTFVPEPASGILLLLALVGVPLALAIRRTRSVARL